MPAGILLPLLPSLTPLTQPDPVFPQFNLSPALLCPYVKDGKQLPGSWFSQRPVVFGRLPGLTGLTCSFPYFGVWTETMTKYRQICCCPEPLIQGLTPNAWHMHKVCYLWMHARACTHAHTEACYPELISYREHCSREWWPVIHGVWLHPSQMIYQHHCLTP